MSTKSELKIVLTQLYLADGEPFNHVQKRNNVYGDLWVTVGGVPFPDMSVISSGEVNLRWAIMEVAGLRQIKAKRGSYDMELYTGWRYTCFVRRDYDSIFLKVVNSRGGVEEGFDDVELSRQQVIDEISCLKRDFLRIATEGASKEQAEALWQNVSGEYVEDEKNGFWKW